MKLAIEQRDAVLIEHSKCFKKCSRIAQEYAERAHAVRPHSMCGIPIYGDAYLKAANELKLATPLTPTMLPVPLRRLHQVTLRVKYPLAAPPSALPAGLPLPERA